MPREYFGCWNPTYGDLNNTETTSEETFGSGDRTRGRRIKLGRLTPFALPAARRGRGLRPDAHHSARGVVAEAPEQPAVVSVKALRLDEELT